MKISSFYLNDISEYDNFIEKFINDIDMKFYKTGHNSLNIGRFINFFRTEITKYIQIKFNKKIHIVLTLPKNEVELIEKSNTSSSNILIFNTLSIFGIICRFAIKSVISLYASSYGYLKNLVSISVLS